jgi:NADP-dependent 3-hydroxy acid dehydrogenase YdfG
LVTTEARDLAGQVILITGAGSGIGRATAIAVAGAGACVVLAARRGAALDELVLEIRASGGVATAVPTDLTDQHAVEQLIGAALAVSGRLDAIVHAAGTNIKKRALDELTRESWSALIDTNLTSAFYLSQAAVPAFRAQGGGLIIYIASMAAKKPDRSGIAYQASKAGAAGLAHGMMEEERANGVRATVIFPGFTDTPLQFQRPVPTPPEVLARALQPEDVAAACLFVLRLPARAHVPELLLTPSQL